MDSLAGEDTLIDTMCRWMRTGSDEEPFAITKSGYDSLKAALETTLKLPVLEAAAQIEAFLCFVVALDTELECPMLAALLWRMVKRNPRAVAVVRQARYQDEAACAAEVFAQRWGNGPARVAPRMDQVPPEGTLKASALFDVGQQNSKNQPKVVVEKFHPACDVAMASRSTGGRR